MFALTGQTYTGKQALEQIIVPGLKFATLQEMFFFVKTGLKVKEQIFYLQPIDKITTEGKGCDPASTAKTIGRTEKYWDPTPLDVRLEICWTELYGQLEQAALKGGTDVPNLSKTKVEKILLEMLEPVAARDMVRIAWLGKKTIVNGELTNGAADVPHYRQLNGLAYKIESYMATHASQLVVITQNAGADSEAQELPAGEARKIFRKMLAAQTPQLRSYKLSDKVLYVTRELYENYYDELENNSNLESARAQLIDGVQTLKYRGIPLVVLDILDHYLAADFSPAGLTTDPHRAYLTVRNNFQYGVDTDSADPLAMVQFYDQKSRKNYFDLQYKMDVQIADELLMVAAQ